MTDETKNLCDIVLTILAMCGGVVAFRQTLREWREAQRWRRTEQLDKIIERFESDDLLRLARVALDWTVRDTTHAGKPIRVTNDDVLLALRFHRDLAAGQAYGGEQAILRDAYDAFIAFLGRLNLALENKLIDVAPSEFYFHYWLKRFTTMDWHPDSTGVLGGKEPHYMVAQYVEKYGDPKSILHFRKAEKERLAAATRTA